MIYRTKEYDGCSVFLNEREIENKLYEVDVTINFDKEETPKKISVTWDIDCIDVYSHYTVSFYSKDADRGLRCNWAPRKTSSRLANGAPIHSLVSQNNKNRLLIALSDADTPLEIETGIVEETSKIRSVVNFFTLPIGAIKEYSTKIRIDLRDIDFCDSFYDAGKWWEKMDMGCAYVPKAAKLPMYSTWYSFHQDLEPEKLLKQCRLAKEMGMETIIVDDGWQTDNCKRGYAYCGDWEVAPSKIPDMKKFVQDVHDTGMKIMLWYAMPFVGKHSKVFDRFKDMLLTYSEGNELGELDPRFKEVRDYLADIYLTALKEWGVDGFKLDFIDSFMLRDDTPEFNEGRDTQSLERGIEMLLKEVTDKLREVNPEILIEFRQGYMGPKIRRYGNMLRVGDCPNDALINKCESVMLRLTSGATAVHSDMIMWNYDESAEIAARQLLGVIFSVPQISVLIDKISEEHYKMLKFYLDFCIENKDVLLDGKMMAYKPESNFPKVASETDNKYVVALYSDNVADLNKNYEKIFILNATAEGYVVIRAGLGAKKVTVKNCFGDVVSQGVYNLDNTTELEVPLSGMIVIE